MVIVTAAAINFSSIMVRRKGKAKTVYKRHKHSIDHNQTQFMQIMYHECHLINPCIHLTCKHKVITQFKSSIVSQSLSDHFCCLGFCFNSQLGCWVVYLYVYFHVSLQCQFIIVIIDLKWTILSRSFGFKCYQ